LPADKRISHHDLCFGCGQANLFGLQLEVEPRPEGGVEGRFFVKQDHQGAAGFAHDGVMAAALAEAMSLVLEAAGSPGRAERLEVELHAPASVGTFVRVEADVESARAGTVVLTATASGPDGPLASGRAIVPEP
jgi:acyl-coenzyme A thioesterase PaaI-like protein